MIVDAEFPGGNIIVEQIAGDTISVRQDLRDTEGFWFYWYFRVRGSAGRNLRVVFTDGGVVGVRGPAVSIDGGMSWKWLLQPNANRTEFRYSCPPDADEVRFSFAIPYLQENLDSFRARYSEHPALRRRTLCTTAKGREAEWIQVGRADKAARYRILLTCRHHCCEMMANYVLEGLLEAALSSDDLGCWYRDNVLVDAVPFVDKDGVEQGDQGKNRRPRDHGRDYLGESIYPETGAIRRRWLNSPSERPDLLLDLHCPTIGGEYNEYIYFVGNQENWQQIQKLSAILETSCSGPLVFQSCNNLPFGQAWNIGANYDKGRSIARAAQGLSEIRLAASMEIPYANASGIEVTPDACRAFGRDLCAAIRGYLEQ